MIGLGFWAWIGTISLIILTWQDFRNNMTIDDRKNFFMFGVTISILSHINRPFLYILFLLIFNILLTNYLEKRKVFASGDISALRWIFYGFGLLNIYYLMWFMIYFTIITLFYFGFKKIYEKLAKLEKNRNLPFFGVILISFWFTCFILGLY